MLSLGTELFLAFWMASKSVGFPPGSPPPILAATSMFLISLANILPRRASMTAFLCLVVAHFEWPDMGGLSSLVDVLGRSGPGTGGGRGRHRPPRGGRRSPSAPPAGQQRLYRRRGPRRRGRAPRRPGRCPRPKERG